MPSREIDDVAYRRGLERRLSRLMDAGKTSSPSELLDRVSGTWPGVDLASPPSQPVAPEEIYRTACRSVVAVGKLYLCGRCGKRHASIASGFVIAGSGMIVTNYHVVDDADKLALGIMCFDGSVFPVLSVLGVDRSNDLAVLEVPGNDLTPLPLGDEPPVGAPVYVLSHPAGRLFTFTAGIVSRYVSGGASRDEHAQTDGTPSGGRPRSRLMTITADFGQGSSGAPVLDAYGAVVGVARQTKSLYHRSGDADSRRLQMVLKHCVPSSALRDLGLRSEARGRSQPS